MGSLRTNWAIFQFLAFLKNFWLLKVVPLSNGMQVGIIFCCYLRHLRCQLRKRCGSERGRYQHLLLFTPKMKNPFEGDGRTHELITSELRLCKHSSKNIYIYIYLQKGKRYGEIYRNQMKSLTVFPNFVSYDYSRFCSNTNTTN